MYECVLIEEEERKKENKERQHNTWPYSKGTVQFSEQTKYCSAKYNISLQEQAWKEREREKRGRKERCRHCNNNMSTRDACCRSSPEGKPCSPRSGSSCSQHYLPSLFYNPSNLPVSSFVHFDELFSLSLPANTVLRNKL